ncbi:MAG: hypothetical protein ACLR6J_10065 [Parabacteroides merdae]
MSISTLSDDSTVHKDIHRLLTEHKVGERVTILLTPGDSITQDKELFATTHKRRYQGRGSEQNNSNTATEDLLICTNQTFICTLRTSNLPIK